MRYLSYMLDSAVPVYGSPESARVEIRALKSLSAGDTCRTFRIGMENHWGTHIDSPAHFFEDAPSLCDYPPEHWFFSSPQVIEIPIGENALIGMRELDGMVSDGADMLLIRTGFHRFRGQRKYGVNNPGVKSEVGRWLRRNYGTVRAIGFDFVSLSSYSHRQEGREAHRAFLDPRGDGRPVLVIEDMDLSGDLRRLKGVWAVPILIRGTDSAPCTVIGVEE